ncbi:Protein of unknown function [Gryllus bimaculatus]|nr:Protein of unknown function [Gryllus bimaculatus]
MTCQDCLVCGRTSSTSDIILDYNCTPGPIELEGGHKCTCECLPGYSCLLECKDHLSQDGTANIGRTPAKSIFKQ